MLNPARRTASSHSRSRMAPGTARRIAMPKNAAARTIQARRPYNTKSPTSAAKALAKRIIVPAPLPVGHPAAGPFSRTLNSRRMPMLRVESPAEPCQSGHPSGIHVSHRTDGAIQQDTAQRAQSGTQECPPYAAERRNTCRRGSQHSTGERRGQAATARDPAIVVSRLSCGRRWCRETDGSRRSASRRLKSAERVRLGGPRVCHFSAPVRLLNSDVGPRDTQGTQM